MKIIWCPLLVLLVLLSGCSTNIQTSSSSTYTVSYSTSSTGAGAASSTTKTLSTDHLIDGESVTYTDQTFTTTGENTTAFLVVNGGSLTLNNCTIVKSGDGGTGDDYNFYGLNSAVVVAESGSTCTLNGCTITTEGTGANAVFATSKAAVTITNGITITTNSGSSRGLYATYDGTITAAAGGVSITTYNDHCAALATDRGGGTVTVGGTGNTLTTYGDGSPSVYSTDTITLSGATCSSDIAQGVVVEGLNTVTLNTCSFTALKAQGHGSVAARTNTSGDLGAIMLYQSTSGDSSSGQSTLTMKNCSFDYCGSETGVIVETNTTGIINASGSTFTKDGSALSTSDCMVYLGSYSKWSSNGGTLTYNGSGSSYDQLAGTVYAVSGGTATINCAAGSTITKASSNAGNVTITTY